MKFQYRKTRGLRTGLIVIVAMLTVGTGVSSLAQDFSVDWHTIDGGGEVLSETADQTWQLSGTIGQPDATELIDLAGNGWTLTGGFWAGNIEQTDILFRDEFEGGPTAPGMAPITATSLSRTRP